MFFCKGWLNSNKDVLVIILFWQASLDTFIYGGLVLLKSLNVSELIHCSKLTFTGSQLIFSNSVKPIWGLLFKFRQNRMYLVWSTCNFDFNVCFVYFSISHAYWKWDCIKVFQISLGRVSDKNLFFPWNLSLVAILLFMLMFIYKCNSESRFVMTFSLLRMK